MTKICLIMSLNTSISGFEKKYPIVFGAKIIVCALFLIVGLTKALSFRLKNNHGCFQLQKGAGALSYCLIAHDKQSEVCNSPGDSYSGRYSVFITATNPLLSSPGGRKPSRISGTARESRCLPCA